MTAYLFTHIPKAAGSWVRRNCIEPNFAPQDMIHFGGSARQIPEVRRAIAQRRGRDVAVWGHFVYGFHRLLPVDCRYFTVLREPVDRAVSYYYFVQETKIADHHHPERDLAMSMSLLDFSARPSARDVQSRYLAGFAYDRLLARGRGPGVVAACRRSALSHLRHRYDVVGFQDDLSGFADRLSQAYGWTCHGDRGRTWTTDRRPQVDDLSPEAVAELRRLNAMDLEVYDAARGSVSTTHITAKAEAELSSAAC